MKQTPTNSEQWLEFMETQLKEKGYNKYKQQYKNSTFQYWKTVSIEGKKQYQIGVCIYDYKSYGNALNPAHNRYGISFELIFLHVDFHVNLNVSRNMDIDFFEKLCSEFHEKFMFKDLTNEKE